MLTDYEAHTTHRTLTALIGVGLALAGAPTASAAPVSLSPVVVQLQNGLDAGPQEEAGGPGFMVFPRFWLTAEGIRIGRGFG